jgi:CRISP-associated protein Cas1
MARVLTGANRKADDIAWAERCEYWAAPIPKKKRRGAAPRRIHEPLVLRGHGVGLRVDQGTLLIKDGFTHYPQVQTIHRFFPRDRNMPSRIIIVDGNGNITLDTLSWLAEQNVPLVRIDWQGNVMTVISNSAGPDHRAVRAQLAAQADKGTTLRIATSLVLAKIQNMMGTLRGLPASERIEQAIGKQEDYRRLLKQSQPKSIQALLGVEGGSARSYFSAWQGLLLRWKGTSRKPIPADWLSFTSRTSLQSTKPQNRNASHPVNAMLNYAYTVLESRVRSEIVAYGYDPMIGYLHSYDKERAALVFDLMEPLRPVVDHAVLDFVHAETFDPADFTLRGDGVCRLNPELTRVLIRLLERRPFSINLLLQRSFKLPQIGK